VGVSRVWVRLPLSDTTEDTHHHTKSFTRSLCPLAFPVLPFCVHFYPLASDSPPLPALHHSPLPTPHSPLPTPHPVLTACRVSLVDSQFLSSPSKFISGALMCLSVMVQVLTDPLFRALPCTAVMSLYQHTPHAFFVHYTTLLPPLLFALHIPARSPCFAPSGTA
jgi:hypothetical protein